MADSDENEEISIRRRIKATMRSYRLARGWSQREMASFLQLGEKSYEKYETDESRGVPAGIIARFCNFTNTDINWIMLGRKARQIA